MISIDVDILNFIRERKVMFFCDLVDYCMWFKPKWFKRLVKCNHLVDLCIEECKRNSNRD